MLENFVRVSRLGGLILIMLSALAGGAAASAQILTPLANFSTSNGAYPYAGLIADANGNLFGTTKTGGTSGYGTVFEIVKDQTTGAYASTPTTLVSFNLTDGAFPYAGLIADASDNLFGTTRLGGTPGYGTVFEIVKDQTTGAYASTPTTLVSFNDSDGAFPYAGLIADASGDLFGTTELGGASGDGTVFEIVKDQTTGAYASTPTTLVSFNDTDGANPYAGLIADSNGDLFGTTSAGGSGNGTVFEVVKNSTSGYASAPTTLVSFNYTDGASPFAGLIADANGDLFGTTSEGGASGDGTVFEVVKNSTSGYASAPTTLASFDDTDGANPYADLIADANGNLFGTTLYGGGPEAGTVFEVVKDTTSTTGYASTPNSLIVFNGTDEAYPYAGLIADANGNLFGTTFGGGASGVGTVFEISASGFATQVNFMGTPGTPNCTGDSISNLTHTYGGIAHAASSLGYASVKDLQNAVSQYCSQ